jgi:hypothetical protein
VVEAVAETVGDVLAREMPAELLGNELAADAAAELEIAAVDAAGTVDAPEMVVTEIDTPDTVAAEAELTEPGHAEFDAGPAAVTEEAEVAEAEVAAVPELDVSEAETAEMDHDGPEVSDDAYDAADLARLDEVDPSPAGEPAAL